MTRYCAASRPGFRASVASSTSTCRRRAPLIASTALATLLAVPPPSAAQQFGQWSWEAALRARQVTARATLDDTLVNSRDETNLNLALAARGFIVHPAIARFRLGVDLDLSKFKGTLSRDNRTWGFDASLSGLPRGAYPFSVFAHRRKFTYSDLRDEDPLSLLGVPDTSTAFGGRLRIRKGFLLGTQLGFDRQGISYNDASSRTSLDQRAFADWARSSRNHNYHLRLRHRIQEFRLAEFGTRDLALNYDQRGHLAPSWRWDMFVIGLHRNLGAREEARSTFDNLRTRQLFVHTMSGQNRLELSYRGGLTRGTVGSTAHSHSVTSRFRWRARRRWEVTPFASWAYQVGQGLTVQAPQLGLFSSWAGRTGPLDTLVSGSAGYTRFRRGAGDVTGSDSALAMEATATVGHGSDGGLRLELEAAGARNQLRLVGEAIPELPDLGLSLAGLGTEDSLRGRLTLRRRWGSLQLSAFSEVSRRGTSRTFTGQRFTFDRVNHTLQIMGRTFTLTGNLGRSRVEDRDAQSIDNWSASASWRPFDVLSLTAWYRSDSRRLALAPDIDGDRFEVRADLWVGAFQLSGQLYEGSQRSLQTAARTNRGFTISLSRRFGGWLPFVTAPPPGGVIR